MSTYSMRWLSTDRTATEISRIWDNVQGWTYYARISLSTSTWKKLLLETVTGIVRYRLLQKPGVWRWMDYQNISANFLTDFTAHNRVHDPSAISNKFYKRYAVNRNQHGMKIIQIILLGHFLWIWFMSPHLRRYATVSNSWWPTLFVTHLSKNSSVSICRTHKQRLLLNLSLYHLVPTRINFTHIGA